MTVQRAVSVQHNRTTAHIARNATEADVLQSSAFADSSAMVVSRDGRIVKCKVSERDIERVLGNTGPDPFGKPIQELLTTEVSACALDNRAAGIVTIVSSRRVRHLPVATDGKVVGMASTKTCSNCVCRRLNRKPTLYGNTSLEASDSRIRARTLWQMTKA